MDKARDNDVCEQTTHGRRCIACLSVREGQLFEANRKLDVAGANDVLYLELCELGLCLKINSKQPIRPMDDYPSNLKSNFLDYTGVFTCSQPSQLLNNRNMPQRSRML